MGKRLNRAIEMVGRTAMAHPYKFFIGVATTMAAAMMTASTYPTQEKEEQYKRDLAMTAAYKAALPKEGETIEVVAKRMAEVSLKYNARPMNEGYEVPCLQRAIPADKPLQFQGSKLLADPVAYFNCLRDYQPYPNGLQSPTETFNNSVYKVAPAMGLLIGGFMGLVLTNARRLGSPKMRPAAN